MPGTAIDYPVLQGATNMSYINTDVYGEFAMAGSIYLDSRNDREYKDIYSLLYWHNMSKHRMFSDVNLYKDEEFFKENHLGMLLMEDGGHILRSLSCILTSAGNSGIFNPENWDNSTNEQKISMVLEDAVQVDQETLDMLKNCTELEYLEIIPYAHLELDLHPLAKMTKLEHLNMCGMGKTEGWEVLLNMPRLKRLWIGRQTAYYFPEGAMEQILEALPEAEVFYKEDDGATGRWRHNADGTVPERYLLLRQQFDYDHWQDHAPYPYNDPLYKPPWERA